MIALLYACSWIGLWVTFIGGFFVPPLWVWTVICIASICILPTGGERVVRETRETKELTLGQSTIRGLSPLAILLFAVLLLKVFV